MNFDCALQAVAARRFCLWGAIWGAVAAGARHTCSGICSAIQSVGYREREPIKKTERLARAQHVFTMVLALNAKAHARKQL